MPLLKYTGLSHLKIRNTQERVNVIHIYELGFRPDLMKGKDGPYQRQPLIHLALHSLENQL